jgi:hypothetical protein
VNAADRTRKGRGVAAAGDGVKRATGRSRPEWFAVLDAWGAAGRPYGAIAAWLVGDQGLSKWWAQKLIVEYEQARGIRDPGVRRDGTFEVGASKTVDVPVSRLFEAFVDARLRKQWLPGAALREDSSQPERSVRFDWGNGASRVDVGFDIKGQAKSQVTVQHKRLPDAKSADATKTLWRKSLADLKALLERAAPTTGAPSGSRRSK